jgi:hypothetical protein
MKITVQACYIYSVYVLVLEEFPSKVFSTD